MFKKQSSTLGRFLAPLADLLQRTDKEAEATLPSCSQVEDWRLVDDESEFMAAREVPPLEGPYHAVGLEAQQSAKVASLPESPTPGTTALS